MISTRLNSNRDYVGLSGRGGYAPSFSLNLLCYIVLKELLLLLLFLLFKLHHITHQRPESLSVLGPGFPVGNRPHPVVNRNVAETGV